MITLSVARYYKNEETKQTSSRIRIHSNSYCFDPSLVSIYLLFNFSFCSDASITSYIKQLNPLLLVIFRNQVSGDSCYSIYKYFPDWPMTNSLTLNHHYIPFHLFFFFSRIYFLQWYIFKIWMYIEKYRLFTFSSFLCLFWNKMITPKW